jgi:hypothetical protein
VSGFAGCGTTEISNVFCGGKRQKPIRSMLLGPEALGMVNIHTAPRMEMIFL